jgi:transposase
LPAAKFTGQAFHRLAKRVTEADLEGIQVVLARAIVERFSLQTEVLAFDTTNFDTHIATPTPGELARRGHAKSKRRDLRVVGLGLLVSETEHVPLLYRTFPGNSSDQAVLRACLEGLSRLQNALDGQGTSPSTRTLVRDGGFWSPDLEQVLDLVGYSSLISLPLGHKAAQQALLFAATRGAMKRLGGSLRSGRAARLRCSVGKLDRTLIVVESPELLAGQKRGVAARLAKAKEELRRLGRQVEKGRLTREAIEKRAQRILAKEHLATFVEVTLEGHDKSLTLTWRVDATRRKELERTRLGRRVLCTDQHMWRTERIVRAAHGQWKVEELFRRTKKGAVVPWGPSHQRADSSLRLHTFATVLGLTLVSLARVALSPESSALAMMESLRGVEATLVRTRSGEVGRPETVMLPPELTAEQSRSVEVFELGRWLPSLVACRRRARATPGK